MSLARSSPSYGTQPYPTALLDIYRSIKLSLSELLSNRLVSCSSAEAAQDAVALLSPKPTYSLEFF